MMFVTLSSLAVPMSLGFNLPKVLHPIPVELLTCFQAKYDISIATISRSGIGLLTCYFLMYSQTLSFMNYTPSTDFPALKFRLVSSAMKLCMETSQL